MGHDAERQLSPCELYLDALARDERELDGHLSRDYGFLPSKLYLLPVPASHAAWEEAARQLPSLIFDDMAQRRLAEMPELPADPASLPDRYLKRSAVIMAMLAGAYWRFGVDRFYLTRNTNIEDHLPDSILVPWKEICRRLGRQRHYSTLDDFIFNNFFIAAPSGQTADGGYTMSDVIVENIKTLVPALDNEAERVFYASFVEIHAAATPLVSEICLMQRRILESGPDASDDVAEALTRSLDCVKRATAALQKINAQERSTTYCDPILWSKTIATFVLPPKSFPSGPLSGACSPLVHVLDALVGRVKFQTEYGKFSKKIQDHYITDRMRAFLAAMQEVGVKEYVRGMKQVDDARYCRLSSAFDDLVDGYAGPGGFLDKHVSKVYHYLGIGTLVGRNQSTSGDERYIRKVTWADVSRQLRISAEERLSEKAAGFEAGKEEALDAQERADLPRFSMVDLVKHRYRNDGWIALHGRVIDVTGYLSKHPGGAEILSAHLGRDASMDFGIISGHASGAVKRLLLKMSIGSLKPPRDGAPAKKWYSALDHLATIHNAFQIQFNHDVDPINKLVFCGQAYCHFLDEHLGDIADLLSRAEGNVRLSGARRPDERRLEMLLPVKAHVKAIVSSADKNGCLASIHHMKKECYGVIDRLIDACSSVITRIESGPGLAEEEDTSRVDAMISLMDDWIEAQLRFWTSSDRMSSSQVIPRKEAVALLAQVG